MNNHFDIQALRHMRGAALRTLQTGLVLGVAIAAASAFTTASADPVKLTPLTLPTFADLAEKVGPAVVSVRVRLMPQQSQSVPPGTGNGAAPIPPQAQRGGTALGSGFFITGDGYVVTNNHVVENASNYTIIMEDGSEYPATLIGKDDKTDLALLKVDRTDPFTYVKWADGEPRIGDWVVAIGNPFGLGGTVTMGIVSARGRQLSSGIYDDYLQIDAPINRGNSGGPTFNTSGEVVGINTAIYSTTGGSVGIAFDIPAATASAIISTLKEHGAVARGWLGVQTQPVTGTIAATLKLTAPKGAMIADPQMGSPADVAGIKAGDVIVAIDGKPIADPRDLALRIAGTLPDTTIHVSVWRDGSAQDIAVKLGTLPPDAAPVATPPRGGNGNGGSGGGGGPGAGGNGRPDNSAEQRDSTPVPDLGLSVAMHATVPGVDILAITPDGPADMAGLSNGDVILSASGNAVSSAADVEGAIAKAKQAGDKAVLLQIQSGQNKAFLAVPLG